MVFKASHSFGMILKLHYSLILLYTGISKNRAVNNVQMVFLRLESSSSQGSLLPTQRHKFFAIIIFTMPST